MALSSPGIGSNLDINGIISQLMSLERRPLTVLDQREAGIQAKLTTFGTVKGAVAGLQTALAALTTPARFSTPKATLADSTIASASASSNAATGTHSIEVQHLAQSHRLKSKTFTAVTDVVGTGTLTIQFGTYDANSNKFTPNADKTTKAIAIDAGHSTLSGVRDAINAANAGVTASVVNDGTGYRLVLGSNDTGVANSIRLTVVDTTGGDVSNVDDSGLSQLAYDPTAAGVGTGKNMSETQAAQNAEALIDGLAVSKASNTISDVIQGVTLSLLKTNANTPTTLTVAKDAAGVKSAIEGFVKAYNDANKSLKDAGSAQEGQVGALVGDATVRGIQSQIRSIVGRALSFAPGGLSSLSEVGISFQKDGTLKFDSSKLQKAVDDPTKDVSTLFSAVARSTDSLISVTATGDSIRPGNYSVNVTQVATQGRSAGSAVLANPTTIATGVNDTLLVEVDGLVASVTLAAGDYTPAALAAEVQSRINGVSSISASGAGVTVTLSGGAATLTSNRYGSDSEAQILGGTAVPTVFGAVDATHAFGLDVAGTIGGVQASGQGQTLSGAGRADGLEIQVLGGTTGERGSVNFVEGIAHQLDAYLDSILASDGLLAKRTEGLNTSVKDIDKRRTAIEARLTQIEARYRAQFSVLDSTISSMQQTSNFLQQQLANLPTINTGA